MTAESVAGAGVAGRHGGSGGTIPLRGAHASGLRPPGPTLQAPPWDGAPLPLDVDSRHRAFGYRHPRPSSELALGALGGSGVVSVGESYQLCRRINAAHGRTYFFATRFLPAAKRRHVHALYAFARYADDLVDHMDLSWDGERRRKELESWSDGFLASLDSGRTDDPVLVAVLSTVAELGIRHEDLRAFLQSMAMDLTVTRYASYDDLYEYMYGSAAVIGAMMLPVLGTVHPQARDRAMDLGVAFQLTNFLRDVAEDWDRGRIYLPLEDLERFGVTEDDFRRRHVTPPLRRLLAFEASRTRALYRRAEAGWDMLAPSSRACIRIAHRLYSEILDRLEAGDYQVFRTRAAVPTARKLAVAARELVAPSRPGAMR
jgi:15-cis-phytoene synthase